jgi:hypothetical protein
MINDESFEFSYDKPVLTGSSEWSYFYVSFDDLGYDLRFGDTGEQGSFKIDISAFQPGSCLYRLVDRSSNRTSHGKFIVK